MASATNVKPGSEPYEESFASVQAWHLVRSWARLAIALTIFSDHWISHARHLWASWPLEASFVGYALVALIWGYRHHASRALLGLCLDTIFYLSIAQFGADHSLWLDAVFYLYLMLSAGVFHGWREACLIFVVCAVTFLVSPSEHDDRLMAVITVAGILGSVLAFRGSRIERLLASRSAEADQLRLSLGTVVDAERQRIAGDFHDGPLQQFIGLQMRLEVLARILQKDTAAGGRDLADLQQTAKSQVRELRAFLRGLRPSLAPGNGLVAVLRQAVDDFQKDTGTAAVFQSEGLADHELNERTTELAQIVREALHNVQKHAGASRVAVHAARAGDGYVISIDDNGDGFVFSGAYSLAELEALGIGPGSIKRRVRGLGGELALESHPGRGSALRIRVPA
jgi:signal transduction histidine kinase